MTRTSPTSSLSTATLVGLFDELDKIAQEKKDQPVKKLLKNVALASLGGAAGTGIAMVGHKVLSKLVGARYDKLLPATKMKIIAPAIGIGTTALLAASLVLQQEMKKKDEEKASHG